MVNKLAFFCWNERWVSFISLCIIILWRKIYVLLAFAYVNICLWNNSLTQFKNWLIKPTTLGLEAVHIIHMGHVAIFRNKINFLIKFMRVHLSLTVPLKIINAIYKFFFYEMKIFHNPVSFWFDSFLFQIENSNKYLTIRLLDKFTSITEVFT